MTEVEALINLLQDDDPHIAIIAMEKLLDNPAFIDKHMSELQESADPCLRSRVHQMESIIARKRKLQDFFERVKSNRLNLWNDLIFLNKVIDRELSSQTLDKCLEELENKIPQQRMNTLEFATFMREQNFTVPSEDTLDPGLFLVYEVIASALGNPLLLCIITRHIAERSGTTLTLVLHKGRHCLIDECRTFIDPLNGWAVSSLKEETKVYPCSNRDILLTVISQLYLSALVEGQLRIISQLSQMMAALSDSSVESFPFPVGRA